MKDISKSLAVIFVTLALGLGSSAFAQAPICSAQLHVPRPAHQIEKDLRDQASEKLKEIWPGTSAAVLNQAAQEFAAAIVQGRAQRPAWLKQQDKTANPLWHFEAYEYMFYVDKFGVDDDGRPATFDETIKLLPYLKSLGFNLLYPLPFLKSPGKDAGFDVSSFHEVDPRFGGNAAFARFMDAAKAHGMKVKMDLILNHISDEHPWFQAFINGDMSYKDFFHVLDHPPDIVRKVDDERGRVITYRERKANGEIVEIERRVIFPEISDTHYREVEVKQADGTRKKFWVYYTFYPFQMDLNWDSPAVLRAFYDVMNFWVNQGIGIFRLDAVPFLNKTKESHEQTHLIVQLLNSYLRQVSPNTLIMPEACQPANVIAEYFGRSSVVQNDFVGRQFPTTTEAQLAYDFEVANQNTNMSVILGDKRHAVEADKRKPPAPQNALYGLAVSVHDESTFEMVTDVKARTRTVEKMISEGGAQVFREGLGASSRLAEVLGKNPQRILMVKALALGKKGMPIEYYGDEIMTLNDYQHAVTESKRLAAQMRDAGIEVKSSYDSRHIKRPKIPRRNFLRIDPTSPVGKVNSGIAKLIELRKSDKALVYGEEIPIQNDNNHVYTWERVATDDSTLVVINLSGRPQTVRIKRKAHRIRDLFTKRSLALTPDGDWITLTLAPYAYHWLKPEPLPTSR